MANENVELEAAISEQERDRIIRLEDEENAEIELDNVTRLYLKSSNKNLIYEIKYPNLRRIANNLSQKDKHLKEIHVKIKPDKTAAKKSKKNVSLCEQLLGIFVNNAFDPQTNEQKLIIQGFMPNKQLFKQKILKIGDLLTAINDIQVNSANFEVLLSAIKTEQTLKLTALSPLTYLNINTNDLLMEKLSKKATSSSVRCVAPSKSTSVVKGDRVKHTDQTNSNDIFYMIMILSLNKETIGKNQNANDKDDIIYKYPNDYNNKEHNNINMIELIETVRGLFMTLAFTIKDIDKSDKAVCGSIEHQQQSFYVSFLDGNYGENGLLVFLVPTMHIDLTYFKMVSNRLNDTFRFTFGHIWIKMISVSNDQEMTIEDNDEVNQNLKSQMDAFFSQINKRLKISSLFNTYKSEHEATANKLNTFNNVQIFSEMRSKLIDQIPFYDLPFDLKCDLDSALNDLEAQEFVDLENIYYKHRRQFLINGCCIFYKDYLIATHLNEELTRSVYYYAEHYDLFNMIRRGNSGQFHIWKEISLGLNKHGTNDRFFLVLVGYREFLFAMVLESCELITRKFDWNHIIEPEPFYIKQATYLLCDIYENGIMDEINRNFEFGSKQIIFNLNKFLNDYQRKDRKKHFPINLSTNLTNTSTRPNSTSKSPMRFKLAQTSRSKERPRSASNQIRHRSPSPLNSNEKSSKKTEDMASIRNGERKSLAENDLYPNDDYHYQKEQRHMNLFKSNKQDSVGVEVSNKYFTDCSLNESLIFYASSHCNLNGVLFIPRNFNINSKLFQRFYFNFVKCSFRIRDLLDFQTSLTIESNEERPSLIEQGLLFNLIINEGEGKAKKPKEMSFWVVGRRRLNKPISQTHTSGDVFVCFADLAEQILIELAFDLGFSKFAC